jgi:hypothetical protein
MAAGVFSVVPSVDDPGYLLKVADSRPEVLRGAFFQLLMAPAHLGFALALYPVLRRHHPGLALGFVGCRLVAVAFILCGAISLPLFVTPNSTWLKQVDDPACQAAVQTQSAIARTSVLRVGTTPRGFVYRGGGRVLT